MEIIVALGFFLMLFGVGIVIMGTVLWKKQKAGWVSLNENVKKKDIAAFTKMNGQCAIGIGISIFLLGFFEALHLMLLSFIIFAICFVISMTVFFIAQHKYNK